MIKKILIANRGEIALRVIKTCKKLGIKTVSIYASDDATLPHASAADECVALGRGQLSDTYLNQERIIQICKELEVDAIHPGYGFLSENMEFSKKVSEANLIFIGPKPQAIELMGDKITSKAKMETLGIPLIPGYHGDNQDEVFLASEAKKIGFPVLIKATAGGGGKGMRIVREESGFTEALAGAKREAQNAFGNADVLIEKYIEKPRHIEVQLVSDGQGNHFHFFERECSIQRRYQKVVEESPAPNMPSDVRENICNTAVKIAAGIDYIGAGTIEFIMSADNSFYFLEMNTRLQVEHPVTEMTTGFDLVELQIAAANGEAFDFSQPEVTQTGHAIECRIYAEDPDQEFLPTNGRIQKIHTTPKLDFRLDCGYRDGNSISTNYDPMLAKLITWDEQRIECVDKMQVALNDVLFAGTKTNRDYLKRILAHPQFMSGEVHTHFIEEQKEALAQTPNSVFEQAFAIAGVMLSQTKMLQNIWDRKFIKLEKKFVINDEDVFVTLLNLSREGVELELKGETFLFETQMWDQTCMIVQFEGIQYELNCFQLTSDMDYQVFALQREFKVKEIKKAMRKSGALVLGEGSLQSPMPGKIFKILTSKGEVVTKGDPVMIVEAMKMEHTIRAPKDGKIIEIFFNEGDQVQGGVLLCEIE